MGFMDSVKGRLGLGNKQNFDDDYDEYDDYDEGGYDDYDEGGYDYDDDATSTDMYADTRSQNDFRASSDYSSQGYSRNGGVKVVPRGADSSSYSSSSYGSGSSFSSSFERTSKPEPVYDWRSPRRDTSASDSSQPEFLRNRNQTDARHATVSLRGSADSAYDEFLSAPRTAPSSPQMKIVAPGSYAEAEEITLTFKMGIDVALSLSSLRPELAKRILDFSFGVVSALGGTVEKVGEKLFLLSHSTTGISEDETRQLREAGLI